MATDREQLQHQQSNVERLRQSINDANDGKYDAEGNGNRKQDDENRNRVAIQQKVEEKEPWKITYQNIRCLVSENSKIKINYFKEYAKINKVLIFNLTESWLDENIVEDAKIDGFNEYRSDRVGIKQGGTIIYTHEDLECKLLAKVSKGKCEMIAIEIIPLNTINIVIYRPPKTSGDEFNVILNKI